MSYIFERKLLKGQLRRRPLATFTRLYMVPEKLLPTQKMSVSDGNQSLRLQFSQNQCDFLDILPAAAGEIGESTASVDEKIHVPLAACQRYRRDIPSDTTLVTLTCFGLSVIFRAKLYYSEKQFFKHRR